MTNEKAAASLNCSVTTARRYTCAWCDQDMLSIAKGVCGAMYPPKCDTDHKVKKFAAERAASNEGPAT